MFFSVQNSVFCINKIYFPFRCSRGHPYPEISNTLMFSNMYNHFELEQGLKDDLDTTGNLNVFVKNMIRCSCMYVIKKQPQFQL